MHESMHNQPGTASSAEREEVERCTQRMPRCGSEFRKILKEGSKENVVKNVPMGADGEKKAGVYA
jgi:hypothetical protein